MTSLHVGVLLAATVAAAKPLVFEAMLTEAYGACGGHHGLAPHAPPILASFQMVKPSGAARACKSINKAGEVIGVAYDVVTASNASDPTGSASSYTGGCVDGADWHQYPCTCTTVFDSATSMSTVCQVKLKKSDLADAHLSLIHI